MARLPGTRAIPLELQEAVGQRRSERAGQMMAAFAPIEAAASQGAVIGAQRLDVNAKGTEPGLALSGHDVSRVGVVDVVVIA
jgi:hypothetical protein